MPRTGERAVAMCDACGSSAHRARGVDAEAGETLPGGRRRHGEAPAVGVDRDRGRVADGHTQGRGGTHGALGSLAAKIVEYGGPRPVIYLHPGVLAEGELE